MDSILNREEKDLLSHYDISKSRLDDSDPIGGSRKGASNHLDDDDIKMEIDVKEEILDLGSDIILPQAPQNTTLPTLSLKQKKEAKSKKELEEEEREKMQYVSSYISF